MTGQRAGPAQVSGQQQAARSRLRHALLRGSHYRIGTLPSDAPEEGDTP